jgi:hypothetical protein
VKVVIADLADEITTEAFNFAFSSGGINYYYHLVRKITGMSAPSFIHLRLHSEFSMVDGIVRIDQAVQRAADDGMPALALTDLGNTFALVKLYTAARAKGIKPIIGCEVYVAPGDRRDRSGVPGETQNHLVLLAEVQNTAAGGLTATENITIAWDEI